MTIEKMEAFLSPRGDSKQKGASSLIEYSIHGYSE